MHVAYNTMKKSLRSPNLIQKAFLFRTVTGSFQPLSYVTWWPTSVKS